MAERSLDTKPYEHIIRYLKPGEKFRFNPVLDQEILDQGSSMFADRKPFEVEGIGKGLVDVFLQEIDQDTDFPYEMPAGEIRPVRYEISIGDLTVETLNKIKASISYEGIRYIGLPDYDKVELEKYGRTSLRFMYWNSEENDEPCEVYFPPDPKILSEIDFSIDKD